MHHAEPKADSIWFGNDGARGDDARRTVGGGSIKPDEASALLVIDVQNCFLPGGSLAVKDGEQVVPIINRLSKAFSNVVLTQDWHTDGHVSFASSHKGKKPFETTDLHYGKQVLWPDHCVQGTEGAALSKDLSIPHAGLVIRKGYNKAVDSYSAFTEADGKTTTGLAGYLKARKIKRVFVAGLATDFCVAWTAIDARKAGWKKEGGDQAIGEEKADGMGGGGGGKWVSDAVLIALGRARLGRAGGPKRAMPCRRANGNSQLAPDAPRAWPANADQRPADGAHQAATPDEVGNKSSSGRRPAHEWRGSHPKEGVCQ